MNSTELFVIALTLRGDTYFIADTRRTSAWYTRSVAKAKTFKKVPTIELWIEDVARVMPLAQAKALPETVSKKPENLTVLEDRIRGLEGQLHELREALEMQQRDALRVALDGAKTWQVAIGSHACDASPTGCCAYDEGADRAHDDCLFCHMPEEDK